MVLGYPRPHREGLILITIDDSVRESSELPVAFWLRIDPGEELSSAVQVDVASPLIRIRSASRTLEPVGEKVVHQVDVLRVHTG